MFGHLGRHPAHELERMARGLRERRRAVGAARQPVSSRIVLATMPSQGTATVAVRPPHASARPEGADPSLLEIDPELAAGVPLDERDAACEATTMPVVSLEPGTFALADWFEGEPETFGLYVIEGTLLREVVAGSRSMPHLLGPGDIVEPPARSSSTLPLSVRIRAVTPATLGALGPGVLRAAARWPPVMAAIQRRLAAEHQRIAARGAICQISRVELRILALLLLLADDLGTVGRDGIRIPLPLTHEELGCFVGARRPTVSLALKDLADQDLIERAHDGTWILAHAAEQHVRDKLADHGPPAPILFRRAADVRESAAAASSDAWALRAQAAQAQRRNRGLRGDGG
jgi:CRP-like cAMP-binding protein